MSAHRFCQWPDPCAECDARVSRAEAGRAERDVERETWRDDALYHYEPTFGRMLTRGGY